MRTASELLALLGNISTEQVYTDMTTPEKLMCCFAHDSQQMMLQQKFNQTMQHCSQTGAQLNTSR